MESWVDTACNNKDTWLVLVFHGIDSLGWEWTPIPKLEEYFNYIKTREDRLWIATFGDVTKYMREREVASIDYQFGNGQISVDLSHRLARTFLRPAADAKDLCAQRLEKSHREPGNGHAASRRINMTTRVLLCFTRQRPIRLKPC